MTKEEATAIHAWFVNKLVEGGPGHILELYSRNEAGENIKWGYRRLAGAPGDKTIAISIEILPLHVTFKEWHNDWCGMWYSIGSVVQNENQDHD